MSKWLPLSGCVLAAGIVSGAALPAHAEWTSNERWVMNGPVNTIVRSGSLLYAGGSFTFVGPRTGSATTFDRGTGEVETPFQSDGIVYAAAPDGTGGWYIGGSFSQVLGAARSRLAHVLGDGTLSDWNPAANSDVLALEISNGVVYVAGAFDQVGGQSRHGLAAIDAVTSAVMTWNPDLRYELDSENNEQIGLKALAVDDDLLYVAGATLASVAGQPRRGAASIDVATGAPTAWDPSPNGRVNALVVRGDFVYAGGDFDSIGAQARQRLAALDGDTGAADAWNPGTDAEVLSLATDLTRVYAGGLFANVGGLPRPYVAAIDALTGDVSAWTPAPNARVHAITVNGASVYLAGDFTSVGGTTRNYFAVVDTGTALPNAEVMNAEGHTYVIRIAEPYMFAGGSFRLAGGVWRSGLAALDAANGRPTAWNPVLGGESSNPAAVRAIAVQGGSVYVAGPFASVGGLSRAHLAAIDSVSGLPTAWTPTVAGEVHAIASNGEKIFLGGAFNFVGGNSQNAIAAVDPISGVPTSWDPHANTGAVVRALALRGTQLIVAGAFDRIGGPNRRNLAALDTGTGAATAWDPQANGEVLAIALRDTVLYVGGTFDSLGLEARSRIGSVRTATGAATAWSPNADGPVQALAYDGSVVYAGGSFSNIGGNARDRFAGLDAASGLVRSFDFSPIEMKCLFASYCNASYSPEVRTIEAFEGMVNVGGVFENFAQVPDYFLSSWTADPATPTLLSSFIAEAADGGVRLTWSLSRDVACRIERAPAVEGPWEPLAAAIQTGQGYASATDRNAEPGRTYWYRLVAEIDGGITTFGPIQGGWNLPSRDLAILALSPNPSPDRIVIDFGLLRAAPITVRVVDLQGRMAAVLANGPRPAGRHRVEWSARGALQPGLYFVIVTTPQSSASRRMVVVR